MEEYIAELESLLAKHLEDAETTGNWIDYVKAAICAGPGLSRCWESFPMIHARSGRVAVIRYMREPITCL
ncbi:hypothetical protein EB796_005094 [Bugula neritina]|uniref:Uncharacterized protein n=1 Tax=Bugula neritina TaxID=10212 RepID=A0A7J7KE76_BUGNE|nr:hypothetical protein EB796_005094 [Bugula neritina]